MENLPAQVPVDEPHILIVEDSPTDSQLMRTSLERAGFACDVAPSAEEALELLERIRYELMFVDIVLPGSRGDELVEIVSRQYPRMIIVAVSADDDFRTVTRVLREHKAYDYLLKPFTPGQLQDLAERTLKIAPLRRGGLSFLESEQQYYAGLLATFNWKQEIRARHTDRLATYMMQELYRTLFQGEGPGAMLATLQFLLSQEVPEDGDLRVNPDVRALLELNVNSFARLSECIGTAVEILGLETNVEKSLSVVEVCRIVNTFAADVTARLECTGRKFCIGQVPEPPAGRIPFDEKTMAIVIQELLVNATKYSHEGDTVMVLLNIVGSRHLDIKVVNPAYNDDRETRGGSEIEYLVFTPFFRLARTEMEGFPGEKFGYGLGLTVVRKLVEMHQGTVSLMRIKNYLRTDQFDDICATVRLPIQEADG